MNSKWKVAGITKPLAGVTETVDAGKTVIFDQDNSGQNRSGIYNKRSGKTIPIRKPDVDMNSTCGSR